MRRAEIIGTMVYDSLSLPALNTQFYREQYPSPSGSTWESSFVEAFPVFFVGFFDISSFIAVL